MFRGLILAVTCVAPASMAAAQSPAPPASPAAPAAPQAAASPSPVPPPYTSSAPDARRGAELLRKAVSAHGGAPAIDAIQRLELLGFSGRKMPGQDPVEMSSHTHMVLGGGLYRHELVTSAGPIATLLNRDGAFVLMNGGAVPLPDAEAGALRATANRNLMVLLRTRDPKEPQVARVGSAHLPEGDVEMVEFELSGQKTVLGIDPATGLVRQAIYTMPLAGTVAQVVATYSDYRPLSNGAKYPFKSQGTVDGKPVFSSRLDKILVNGTIDDSLFAVPATPAAPNEPLPWASPSPSAH